MSLEIITTLAVG